MVEVDDGETIVAVEGPLACVHAYELMVAPLVPAAVPDTVTELAGSVITWPALTETVGGVLAGGVTVPDLVLLKNHS